MIILGINSYHADASAALLVDGDLVAAVEEERFTRIKHCAGFPTHAIRYCLGAAGITIRDVDHVAVPRDPGAHFHQKLAYAVKVPRLALERLKVAERLAHVRDDLAAALDVDPGALRAEIHYVEHHLAHLASTFFASPFEQSALLSIDGMGDFVSTMWGVGQDRELKIAGYVTFPHSLGNFYTAVTQYLGFPKYGDEYKVMGLAAYGEPTSTDVLHDMIRLAPDGMGFRLNLRYFCHHKNRAEMGWRDGTPHMVRHYSSYMVDRLGPARDPGAPLEPRHHSIAASLQGCLEERVVALAQELHRRTGLTRLCMAGGVALNCLANARILQQTPFSELFIQPAAYDGGLSLGAALFVHHQKLNQPRRFQMRHAYWGPEYSASALEAAATAAVDRSQMTRLGEDALLEQTAQALADGKVVGWFQGRTEWGPRALGNRSILADPRRADMKDVLNRRIKHRETFRPFAPSILEEAMPRYFEGNHRSPYMQLSYRVRPERQAEIPAPTHVDGTGRLQTVSYDSNPLYWKLLRAFEKQTGVPVLLNTSFNDNEPIVNTPQEALACFLRTRMDVLVMGPCFIVAQPPSDAYRTS
ncbi:MAG: carbamoyltransferase family protein [Candidatus Xenobia bacterium]